MSTPAPLMSTADAAHHVNVSPDAFRTWAYRRGITPAQRVRHGRVTYAYWSAEEVLAGRPTESKERTQP